METIKLLMVVAVVAILVSVFGVVTSIGKLRSVGYAGETDMGNATLVIEGVASINFSRALINWSAGSVDTGSGCTEAVLDTDNNVDCGLGWQAVGEGLILENVGNNNVSVELESSNDADGFIGGTNPLYRWRVHADEGSEGSCVSGAVPVAWQNVAVGSPIPICANFGNPTDLFDNRLEIDLNITVPMDAPTTPAIKLSMLTATATTV